MLDIAKSTFRDDAPLGALGPARDGIAAYAHDRAHGDGGFASGSRRHQVDGPNQTIARPRPVRREYALGRLCRATSPQGHLHSVARLDVRVQSHTSLRRFPAAERQQTDDRNTTSHGGSLDVTTGGRKLLGRSAQVIPPTPWRSDPSPPELCHPSEDACSGVARFGADGGSLLRA